MGADGRVVLGIMVHSHGSSAHSMVETVLFLAVSVLRIFLRTDRATVNSVNQSSFFFPGAVGGYNQLNFPLNVLP